MIDTFEFDSVSGKDPSIISIADDVYALAYEGTGSDGFLVTVTIAADGQITDPAIDTFEFDIATGKTPIIILVAGVYAIVYEGAGTDVFLQTLQILTDGQIP